MFNSQGMILKNIFEKTLMASVTLPPPPSWQMPLKISIFFGEPSPILHEHFFWGGGRVDFPHFYCIGVLLLTWSFILFGWSYWVPLFPKSRQLLPSSILISGQKNDMLITQTFTFENIWGKVLLFVGQPPDRSGPEDRSTVAQEEPFIPMCSRVSRKSCWQNAAGAQNPHQNWVLWGQIFPWTVVEEGGGKPSILADHLGALQPVQSS